MNNITGNTTQADLDAAKKVVRGHKDQLLKANTVLSEVDKNIENYNKELTGLGVDPEKAEDFVKGEEESITNDFNAIIDKINEVETRIKEGAE